ncbi:MAG: hypothetical protein H6740_28035 [Alphaproteobacteria bacterium]|nr:hypothetical protein [Alphaproteobacteria bacterium]
MMLRAEAVVRSLERHPILIPCLVAALLCLPTLPRGYWTDDFMHVLMLEHYLGGADPGTALLQGREDPLGLLNLFGFFNLSGPEMAQELEQGSLPWWTLPELRVSFWRPLSSALALADHALFGRAAWLPHLHSAAWYLALVALVGRLYRRVAPGLAGLALLLFAVDEAHWLPMGWLANRNALVAVVPALAGLLAHLRWREQAWRPGALLGPLGVAVGALGGESFLGVMALFLSYEALAAPGTPGQRLRALLPPAGVALLWAGAYKAMGFGAWGSGLYIDPAGQPLAYLGLAPGRLAMLLGSMFAGVPSDLSLFAPALVPALITVGLLSTLAAGLVLRALWSGLSAEEARALRWLLPGGLLAFVPVLATFPLDRLLLVPGVAGSLLVAATLRWAWAGWQAGRHARGAFGGLVFLVQLLLPLPAWFILPAAFGQDEALQAGHAETAFGGRAALSDTHVVLLNASDMTLAMYFPAWWLMTGHPPLGAYQQLSPAPADHRLTRTGPRRFELEILEGGLRDAFVYDLVRDAAHPIPEGFALETAAGRVEVLECGPRGPRRLALTTRVDPDGGQLLLLSWLEGALVPVRVPAVGERVALPWSPGPRGM